MTIRRDKKMTWFVFFFSFALVVPCMHAGIGEFDDFLLTRAEKAKENAEKSYDPHPEEITDNVNQQVGELLIKNQTRRELGALADCTGTNPIDQCWRCRADWEKDRKKLSECVRGFGSRTTGGRAGQFYIVTDESDNDVKNPVPGTLRHAVIQEVPLWIIFAKSMVIKLQQELMMTSNKTIDGRGAIVHIAYGAGITLQFVQNVIIHGIRIHHITPASGGIVRDSVLHLGLRTMSDGDGINIFSSSNIWVDHNSFGKCADGQVDAIMGSTAITISNNKFNNHDHVMLLGGSDSFQADKVMQVTVAFNRFGKGLVQRMPRVRFGFAHIVNNDYNKWQMYAIGGSSGPTIISQGNRFKAPDNNAAKEVTKREASANVWKNWQWRSEGDLFLNGAYFVDSGPPFSGEAQNIKENLIKAQPGSFAGRLTRYAGALKCKAGTAC